MTLTGKIFITKTILSTLRVGELQPYINHHNILFNGKKDEKARIVKAYDGSKILTSTVLPWKADKHSACLWLKYRVWQWHRQGKGIVGSSSNSSEHNDSGDQAADRQQLEQEAIPESNTSRYGRKRTRVLRENYAPWNNIHIDSSNLVKLVPAPN